MAKYSVAELAAMLPVPITRQSMNDYVKRGEVVRGKDRKIDTRHPVNAAWLATRQFAAPPPTGVLAGVIPSSRKNLPEPDIEPDDLNAFDAEEMLIQIAALDFTKLNKVQVDKAHKMETLLKVRVERQHKRRELIERSLVQSVFSKIYTIDVNELRTLGAKLSPGICGVLGSDDPEIVLAVERIIDNEVNKSLAHIKRLINDFLTVQGAEALPEL